VALYAIHIGGAICETFYRNCIVVLSITTQSKCKNVKIIWSNDRGGGQSRLRFSTSGGAIYIYIALYPYIYNIFFVTLGS